MKTHTAVVAGAVEAVAVATAPVAAASVVVAAALYHPSFPY